jgi:hypothetical protein
VVIARPIGHRGNLKNKKGCKQNAYSPLHHK